MNSSVNWKQVWEDKSSGRLSDFELDRGRSLLDLEIENLSEQRLVKFIEPKEFETLLDAGCGTGMNIVRLHSRVQNIIGIDYSRGSLERCQKTIKARNIKNAHVCIASVTDIPLPDGSVNKIVLLSVLQYLDDAEVRQVLREFIRVLVPDGVIILHVKNLSSLYWSTLRFFKKVKSFLGGITQIEHVRTFQWYANELASLNCNILDYDSFNVLILDVMPQKLVSLVRRFEMRHHGDLPFRHSFMRRHGAELLLKTKVPGRHVESSGSDRSSNSPTT